MTASNLTNLPAAGSGDQWIAGQHALRLMFMVAAFANAALLFTVEPLFAKLALPFLGGTPAVWNTALVFYQATLLAGYAYVYVTTRFMRLESQLKLQTALFVGTWILLPLAIHTTEVPPTTNAAALWLIGVMSLSLGPMFFVLSTGAPLLQRWFAESDHVDSKEPYFLYAASNLGSLCALLAYPFVIEPLAGLQTQRIAWSAFFVVNVLGVLLCGYRVSRRNQTRAGVTAEIDISDSHRVQNAASSPEQVASAVRPGLADRVRWIAYSAVPSSLLMGATSFVANDVTALPLLWVIPLALYLLTFVLAFSRTKRLPHALMVRLEPYFLIVAVILVFWHGTLPGVYALLFHFGLLFIVAMVCHGELSRRRPSAKHLTEFFFWISLGGLVGGAFNALVAPVTFSTVLEYPIAIALAGLMRPRPVETRSRLASFPRAFDLLLPSLIAGLLLLFQSRIHSGANDAATIPMMIGMAVLSVLLLSAAEHPLRFSLSMVAVVLIANHSTDISDGGTTLFAKRSYFGVYRVLVPAGDSLTQFVHGTTVHGSERREESRRREPLTYYAESGPVGDLFRFAPAARKPMRRVGIVGLGTGSISCYAREGDRFTYYEIDPLVVDIARNRSLFSFVSDCTPQAEIHVGDARLKLQSAADSSFDVFLLDAFSSDAIPAHLLTVESFTMYQRLLAPGGIIGAHISNKHIDLEPVVATVAKAAGFVSLVRHDYELTPTERANGQSPTVWMVLARSPQDLGVLRVREGWMAPRGGGDTWTDDFSNVTRAIRWR